MANNNIEKLKELERLANELFVSKNPNFIAITDNIEVYYELAKLLYENLPSYDNNEGFDFDYTDFTKKSFFENVEIIKVFYKKHNIKFDFEQVINDGTLDYIKNSKKFYLGGVNTYENGHKLVDTCNNGLIVDSIILVHELSHLRDQPEKGRRLTSDLLTEALAFTDELIFLDYLEELGYVDDVNMFKNYLYNQCYRLTIRAKSLFKLGIVFSNFSNLSPESFELYFNDLETYENDVEELVKHPKNAQHFLIDAWYTMGYCLSTYMYYEYKKDPEFIENIKFLHTAINETDVLSCLKIMNLNDLNADDLNKIGEALRKMTDSLNKINTKKIP